VRLLLERGADANFTAFDQGGYTALHWAAIRGHEEVMSVLITGGADIRRRNEMGWTALAYASAWGRLAIVWLLLGYADGRNLGDMSEALYRACSYGHAEIVRVLLLAGADHMRIAEGQTPRGL
jgi:ankyrin repeat protein